MNGELAQIVADYLSEGMSESLPITIAWDDLDDVSAELAERVVGAINGKLAAFYSYEDARVIASDLGWVAECDVDDERGPSWDASADSPLDAITDLVDALALQVAS